MLAKFQCQRCHAELYVAPADTSRLHSVRATDGSLWAFVMTAAGPQATCTVHAGAAHYEGTEAIAMRLEGHGLHEDDEAALYFWLP